MEKKRVNILGTEYVIIEVSDEESDGLAGTTDFYTKEIKLSDLQSVNGCVLSTDKIDDFKKEVLRHEIIHAFLFESGLDMQSGVCENWATNEEMVDWFAIQSPKIFKVFQELEIL